MRLNFVFFFIYDFSENSHSFMIVWRYFFAHDIFFSSLAEPSKTLAAVKSKNLLLREPHKASHFEKFLFLQTEHRRKHIRAHSPTHTHAHRHMHTHMCVYISMRVALTKWSPSVCFQRVRRIKKKIIKL